MAQRTCHDDVASFFGVLVFKKRCFTGCNLVMLQKRNILCQSLLPPNVCQWPVAWTWFGTKHWKWWHAVFVPVSEAGAWGIQSGEGPLPVPPEDSHCSSHYAGPMWRWSHNIVTFDIWRPDRWGFHRKEEPLGAARGTKYGDTTRAATVTAGIICLLAWSWLHQGIKKSWGSCGMMGLVIHQRSQHHHFFQLCKIREVDGFLKTSVFDRNLGFSIMTCFFEGFGSSWYIYIYILYILYIYIYILYIYIHTYTCTIYTI